LDFATLQKNAARISSKFFEAKENRPMTALNPAEFLKRCGESSQAAYDLFKELLEQCTQPDGAGNVRRFLQSLKAICDDSEDDTDSFIAKYHFAFSSLTLDGHSQSENQLTLLQLPSIFTPEDWSFTFFEGLARYPAGEFQGRTIAELGCGNGWISIALARQNQPQKLYGLDINPRAITCARINLLLNALDKSGTPIIDSEGKSLLDRVEFHCSDLLGYAIDKKIQLDRVIGCIPQVLSPEPLLADQFATEDADDQFLYSLSNYCEKQGYIEDQFGLGLIARAVEEAISVCKPSAKIILNMGGRPGAAVLDRLFTRRGFSIRKIWSTKVWQASDTDIQPLVDIEKATPHRFEFYTSLNSDEPICAQTAQAYANAGGRIAHSLSVYEAQLRQPSQIKSLFKLIGQNEFEESRSGLDLSFDNEELAEEKINFIGNIADWLQQKPNLPYSDTEGEPQLRRQIAQFLRSYWRIPMTAKSVFIAPNRRSLIKNHLQLFRPKLTFIDKELNAILGRKGEDHLLSQSVVLEIPKRADEICKLIEKLQPELAIVSLQDFEVRSSDAFVRLCEVAKSSSTRLLIDLSQQFELSSQPSTHGVLSFLADNPLPKHVGLLCGLVRNKVYRDLELCFLVSENSTLLEQLSSAAELTYSRTPLLTQKYYSRIFSDLLNFQLTDLRKNKSEDLRLPKSDNDSKHGPLAPFIQKAFAHPAIRTHQLNLGANTTRLDYGENCLKSPPYVHAAIMESYLRQNVSAQELNVEQSIVEFVAHRFGLESVDESAVILGNGVAPLFSAMLETISEKQQEILLPEGAYGYFSSACDFFDVDHTRVRTHARDRFKISAQELDNTISATGAHWLYLNAPIVNPTGAVYSSGEISDILEVLAQHKCGLILDSIFSGLEFHRKQTYTRLSRFILEHERESVPIFLMGGMSKELAAGGLRFGWSVSTDTTLASSIRTRISSAPHSTVKYAAKKIYQALCSDQHPIHEFLDQQRSQLQQRGARLSELLTSLGWEVADSEGGLFVCASPRGYMEDLRRAQPPETQFDPTACADKIAHDIFTFNGLLLNNATWTGLPCHLRFVISVSDDEFESALKKLREFDADWKSRSR
jgi:methionine S-methyltransferase